MKPSPLPATTSQLEVTIAVPKLESLDGGALAASEHVAARRTLRDNGKGELPIWQPNTKVDKVFQSLNVVRPQDREKALLNGAPVLHALPSLGGYVLVASSENPQGDRLKDALGDEYVVASDGPIFQASGIDPASCVPELDPQYCDLSGLKQARDWGIAGEGIGVSVIDTGVDAAHKEFTRRIKFLHIPTNRDLPRIEDRMGFDPAGHGTHVCSVIAGNNLGMAPRAGLNVAGIAEGDSLKSHISRVIEGLDWIFRTSNGPQARGKPMIVNLSLGYAGVPPEGETPEAFAAQLDLLRTTTELFADEGFLIIAAIGNDGPGRFRYPAGWPEALAVGACNDEGKDVMYFSGSAPAVDKITARPDVLGFGDAVVGAAPRDARATSPGVRMSGTSQATAYVSGLAALYWSMDPAMPASEVRDCILKTAAPGPRGCDKNRWGAGYARFAPPAGLLQKHQNR